MRLRLGLVWMAGLWLAGCATTYPALPPPSQEIPRVTELPRLAPAESRVVVDANGEDAWVSVEGRTVCAGTPCAVSLPRGARRLTFFAKSDRTRFEDVPIDLGARPTIVRHQLGVRRESPGMRVASILGFSLGASCLAVGGGIAAVGLVDDSRVWGTTGGAVALTGLVGVALGVTFALAGRTQIWPGATRTWVVPPPAP